MSNIAKLEYVGEVFVRVSAGLLIFLAVALPLVIIGVALNLLLAWAIGVI